MSILRLDGLPFKATDVEIKDWLLELAEVKTEAVHLLLNRNGLASGEAFVKFASDVEAKKATELCDEKNIGESKRYVKIHKAEQEELDWHLQRQELFKAEQSKELFCVRMYGLPFKVSDYEVAKWFKPVEAKCIDVQIHHNSAGRKSGDATAFFTSIEEAKLAITKDKDDMAGRYINLSMDTAAATFNGVTQSKYCLKMSGLPFRATEQEMKDFFQPDAECQSVKVILNRDGRPSGDAIASFEDEEALEKAMVKDREHLGSRFVVLSKYDETNNGSMNGGTSAGGNFVIRMGGLPYKAKVKEIIEWFGPDVECLRVRILRSRDNRPSGEALAEFATKEEAENAMLKNKEYLGERFVVLTRQDF